MGPDFLRLNGFTRDDRHEMISRVGRAFAESNGSILDFKMFSNVSLSLFFELPARRIGELSAALAATGLRLSAESRELLAEWQKRCGEEADPGAPQQTEIAGSLQITSSITNPTSARSAPDPGIESRRQNQNSEPKKDQRLSFRSCILNLFSHISNRPSSLSLHCVTIAARTAETCLTL